MRVRSGWARAGLLLAALLCMPPGPVTAQSTASRPGPGVDYLILVDISGSMMGLPAGAGNPVIFPQVKAALGDFLRTLEPGATVNIWPFADGLRAPGTFVIESGANIDQAVRFVEDLQANGSATWVYQSILETFETYSRGRSPDRFAALMVFTDGLDNGPDRRSMQTVVDSFGLQRRDGDFLYYATLGVELPAAERRALEEAPYAALVTSPAGEVLPIITIQPLLQALDFGNLRVEGQGARLLPFAVRGVRPGSPQPRVSIQGRFEGLESQGAFVRVLPAGLEVSGDARLELEVLNSQSIQSDRFEGFLDFQSEDPTVIVTPSRIRASFTWEAPRFVRLVSGCAVAEVCDLGTLTPWTGLDSAELVLRMDPDTLIRRRGGNFVVEVFPDADLSRVGGFVSVNGGSGQTTLVDATADSLSIMITIPAGGVLEGRYGALLRFENSTADVIGLDSLRVEVQVPRPPRTAGEWLMLILLLLLGALVVFLGFRYLTTGGILPPKMRGRLDVLEPHHLVGISVRLSGLQRIQVGSGSPYLGEMAGSLELFASRSRGKGTRVRMRVLSGGAQVTSLGGGFAIPVASAELKPGDRISIDNHVLLYQPT
jgi:hypothetical protein